MKKSKRLSLSLIEGSGIFARLTIMPTQMPDVTVSEKSFLAVKWTEKGATWYVNMVSTRLMRVARDCGPDHEQDMERHGN